MPGRPHYVCTKDGAVGKCLLNALIGGAFYAQSECPFCPRKILCLDSAQPLYYIAGLFKRVPGYELVVKPLVRNVQVCHDSFLYCNLISVFVFLIYCCIC